MHRPRRGQLRRAERERGATVVMVAVLMSVLLVVAAFAVDIGMQRVGRSDMQALADVVSLDLARHLDGRTASALTSELNTERDRSVARHSGDYGSVTPTVTYELGSIGADGVFVAGTNPPTAVRVTAGTSVRFAFGGLTGRGSGGASRVAVATANTEACFRIGSYALRLDSSSSALLNGILGGMLGGGVNLTAVGYQGLANADVKLLDIAAKLGIGSVDELLSTNVSAADFLLAAADVLSGDGNTASASILSSIAAKVGPHSISVGDLISAASGSTAAETATINAFDLLTGTVFVADGTSAVSVPGLATNLGLTGTNLVSKISIIHKPGIGCGKKAVATADNDQVTASVSGSLLDTTILGLTASSTASVSASVASAHGVLTDIICGNETTSSPSGEDVAVTSGLVGASVALKASFNGSTASSGALGGLLSGLTSLLGSIVSIKITGDISLNASTGDPSTLRTAHIRVPNNPTTWDDPVSTGSGDLGLTSTNVSVSSNVTITAKNILGLNVTLSTADLTAITNNLVSQLMSSTLNPLLTSINNSVLTPLYDILGLSVGGADVFGEKPVCGTPQLVG